MYGGAGSGWVWYGLVGSLCSYSVCHDKVRSGEVESGLVGSLYL